MLLPTKYELFLVFKLQVWSICLLFWDQVITINFLLANADLLKISIFIFFSKTYLQKPHCIMIKNISSNKTQLQLRFVLKNKKVKLEVSLKESI